MSFHKKNKMKYKIKQIKTQNLIQTIDTINLKKKHQNFGIYSIKTTQLIFLKTGFNENI